MTRTLLTSGRIHTPDDPGATSMLIEGERIGWIGQEGAAPTQSHGVDRIIDLAGALVTPAFVDAHVHVTATGMTMTGLDLTTTTGADDVVTEVASFCRDLPAGRIVLGHGWDETTWTDPRVPTREALDAAAPGAAIYLTRIDVHSALASTALLDLIPQVRDLVGFNNDGLLRSGAHHAARAVVLDSIPDEQRTDLHRVALTLMAAHGIAAVHEMAGPDISTEKDLRALLTGTGARPLITAYWGELGGAATAERFGAIGAGGDLFADGALGSRTAALHDPYTDAAGQTGVLHINAEQVRDHVLDCVDIGIQAGFHAIGDRAIDEVASGFQMAADAVGEDRIRAGRHRLEHVEMPSDMAFDIIRRLGLTVSAQPAFDLLWGGHTRMYERRLGADRVALMNPLAAFQRAGIPLAFGSDTPVTAVDPWRSVAAAMQHRTPDHAISARSAFTAHTRGGWRAVGVDDAGVLLPGMRACLAVWEVDEFAVQAPDPRDSQWSTNPASGTPPLPVLAPDRSRPRCLLTLLDGEPIHDPGQLAIGP